MKAKGQIEKQNRSSRLDVFCRIGVFRNFAKFTGKHLCQSLFFNEETQAKLFSCEFCEISKNAFFIEHLQWLVLSEVHNVERIIRGTSQNFFQPYWTSRVYRSSHKMCSMKKGALKSFTKFTFLKKLQDSKKRLRGAFL